MNGKKLIALALSLCLAGSITACGGSAGTEQKAAADGGNAKTQLNVATELTSATLDPADEWNSWFVMRWGALETLTRFEDDGTVSPWLAEDWSVADDQLTWTIKLKENVTFSNGEPMTATKVQESLVWYYRCGWLCGSRYRCGRTDLYRTLLLCIQRSGA